MCFDVVNAKNVNDIKWFCKNTWLLFRFLSMTYGEEMAFLLNKSDMASSIGISVQAFDKWGVPPVERRGREVLYDVKTVLEIDRERRQHNQRTPDDGGELEERLLRARAELTEEQAVAQKLKNQVPEVKKTRCFPCAAGKRRVCLWQAGDHHAENPQSAGRLSV